MTVSIMERISILKRGRGGLAIDKKKSVFVFVCFCLFVCLFVFFNTGGCQ